MQTSFFKIQTWNENAFWIYWVLYELKSNKNNGFAKGLGTFLGLKDWITLYCCCIVMFWQWWQLLLFFQAFNTKFKSGLIYINYSYIFSIIVNSTHLLQGASASQKYTKLYTVALTNVKFVNRYNFWFESVFVNVLYISHFTTFEMCYWMYKFTLTTINKCSWSIVFVSSC